MKYLVLGGAGYVGSHFVASANRIGESCVVVDNLSRGFRAAVPTETAFHEFDILETDRLADVISTEKPDAILHFAAYALVGESVEQPDLYYRNNVEGTESVIAATANVAATTPIVFSSTCAVYGVPKSLPIREDSPKAPISPYGETKLLCEERLKQFVADHPGARATCLRYFNACGADESGTIGEAHDPETHLIPNVLAAALAGRNVKIFGSDFPTEDGTCVRDYVHVTDLASAHRSAAVKMQNDEGYGFQAYNLGTGTGLSILQIIEQARKVTGKEIPVTLTPRRPGDPAALFADTAAAKQGLGFEPQHSNIDSIIASAWRWHSHHPDGF